MAEASIPVDLRNPGQVFACLGLMEAAHALHPDAGQLRREPVTGRYDWDEGAVQARFTLSAPGDQDPVAAAVGFLAHAQIVSLNAPTKSGQGVAHSTAKWDIPSQVFAPDEPHLFPFQPPDSPATLPVRLFDPAQPKTTVPISYWGDDAGALGRDNVKFWAGSGGYPGAALARDALQLIELDGAELADAVADPFGFASPQSSSFSFDWRRSYTPLDAGFSPNAHGAMTMVGYPLVELLAVVGLQNARPDRPDRRNKLAYRYAVSNARLPLVLARPVLGCADLGFPLRTFRMQLGWPGQEGQARCIKDSRED